MKCFVKSKTSDVRLFSALAAMGFAWTESGAVEGGDRTWIFSQVSDCGNWKIGTMLYAWRDKNFHLKNGDHSFHFIKAAMASDMAFRKHFKHGTGFRQEVRGKALVAVQSEETPEEEFNPRATVEVEEAAAYSAAGFRVKRCGWKGRAGVLGIGERSETMPWTYQQVRAWWIDKDFVSKNPQHPFAYIVAALATHQAAVRSIQRDRPLVKWKPKDAVGFAYIHPNCSAETEAKVAGWLSGN